MRHSFAQSIDALGNYSMLIKSAFYLGFLYCVKHLVKFAKVYTIENFGGPVAGRT